MWQEWHDRTTGAMLTYSARTWPDRVALKFENDEVTYAQLQEGALRARNALQAEGIGPGDHVATFMGLGVRWAEIYFAALSLGVRLIPLSLVLTERELADGMRRTDAKYLIIESHYRGAELLPKILSAIAPTGTASALDCAEVPTLTTLLMTRSEQHDDDPGPFALDLDAAIAAAGTDGALVDPRVRPGDVALMLLTSGSTSFPKAVQLTHQAALAGIATYADGMEVGPDDVYVTCAPNYHVAGILTMNIPLLRGATARLMRWFDPAEAMRLIESDKATLYWGFDTHFGMMRDDPAYGKYDLSGVTRTMAASNPAACDRIREMGFAHHGSIYGSTEYMGCQSYFPYADRFDVERMRASHGRQSSGEIAIKDPVSGVTLPAGEPGEICVRGPALFSGYYQLPEETAKCMDDDGFFHSGDQGMLDADGYLYYKGRYKEMVKTGGENVSILEVEHFLETEIPGIRRALVCAAPDPKWGEAVTAMVELDPGSDLTPESIMAACRGRMAGFKIPKHVVLVGPHDWLITPTGKFQRAQLRTLALNRLGL